LISYVFDLQCVMLYFYPLVLELNCNVLITYSSEFANQTTVRFKQNDKKVMKDRNTWQNSSISILFFDLLCFWPPPFILLPSSAWT